MFGIAKKADLERLRTELSNLRTEILRKQEEGFRRLPVQTVHFPDNVVIALDQLVQKIMDRAEPMIKDGLRETVKNVNLEGLSNDIFEGVDIEEIQNRLAEVLQKKVLGELDFGELANQIAESLLENDDDENSIRDQIVENITDRLEVRLAVSE